MPVCCREPGAGPTWPRRAARSAWSMQLVSVYPLVSPFKTGSAGSSNDNGTWAWHKQHPCQGLAKRLLRYEPVFALHLLWPSARYLRVLLVMKYIDLPINNPRQVHIDQDRTEGQLAIRLFY